MWACSKTKLLKDLQSHCVPTQRTDRDLAGCLKKSDPTATAANEFWGRDHGSAVVHSYKCTLKSLVWCRYSPLLCWGPNLHGFSRSEGLPILGREDLLDFKPLLHACDLLFCTMLPCLVIRFAASSSIVLGLWVLTPLCATSIKICIYIYTLFLVLIIELIIQLLCSYQTLFLTTGPLRSIKISLAAWVIEAAIWSWLCAQSTGVTEPQAFHNSTYFSGFVRRARSHDNHASTRLVMTYGIMFHYVSRCFTSAARSKNNESKVSMASERIPQ